MTQCQDAAEQSDEAHQGIAAHDLGEGKHIDSLIAPVAGLVKELDEVGAVHTQHPVVTEDKPYEQEQAEYGF